MLVYCVKVDFMLEKGEQMQNKHKQYLVALIIITLTISGLTWSAIVALDSI